MQFTRKKMNQLPETPIYTQIGQPMKSVLMDGDVRMVAAHMKAKIKHVVTFVITKGKNM